MRQRLRENGPGRELIRYIPAHGYMALDKLPEQYWTRNVGNFAWAGDDCGFAIWTWRSALVSIRRPNYLQRISSARGRPCFNPLVAPGSVA